MYSDIDRGRLQRNPVLWCKLCPDVVNWKHRETRPCHKIWLADSVGSHRGQVVVSFRGSVANRRCISSPCGQHRVAADWSITASTTSQIAMFMGPTWDPSGADRTQVGPMLAPWTLLFDSIMSASYCVHYNVVLDCQYKQNNRWVLLW